MGTVAMLEAVVITKVLKKIFASILAFIVFQNNYFYHYECDFTRQFYELEIP